MSDNRFTDKDNFSEIFRDKLENVEMPVDEACWGEIEARLNARKKSRVVPFWGWLGGGVAVASLALLLLINPIDSGRNDIAQEKNTKSHSQSPKPTVSAKSLFEAREASNQYTQADATKPSVNQSCKTVAHAPKTAPLAQSTTRTVATVSEENTIANQPNSAVNATHIAGTTNNTVAATSDSTSHKTARVLPEKLVPKNALQESKPGTSKSKKHQGWALAAAVGPGLQSGTNGQNGQMMRMSDMETSSSLVGANYYSTESYSDITYHPGLSFGLTARKNLNNRWAIESGIMYTYLNTSMKGQSWYTYDAELELHYLGIPVNVIANLYNKHRWNLYVSGGGMLEKGIRSTYLQHQYFDNGTVANRTHSSINGLQWSLNSAVGISYELQRGLGLYFEPGLSYFFDNAQPTSIRTENPVSVNFKAGLRLTFN